MSEENQDVSFDGLLEQVENVLEDLFEAMENYDYGGLQGDVENVPDNMELRTVDLPVMNDDDLDMVAEAATLVSDIEEQRSDTPVKPGLSKREMELFFEAQSAVASALRENLHPNLQVGVQRKEYTDSLEGLEEDDETNTVAHRLLIAPPENVEDLEGAEVPEHILEEVDRVAEEADIDLEY